MLRNYTLIFKRRSLWIALYIANQNIYFRERPVAHWEQSLSGSLLSFSAFCLAALHHIQFFFLNFVFFPLIRSILSTFLPHYQSCNNLIKSGSSKKRKEQIADLLISRSVRLKENYFKNFIEISSTKSWQITIKMKWRPSVFFRRNF